MSDVLADLGARATVEAVEEMAVPVGACGLVWWVVQPTLAAPTPSRELGTVELLVVLGAVVVVFSWCATRQVAIFRGRRPWVHVVFSLIASALVVGGLAYMSSSGFAAACAERGGEVLVTQGGPAAGATVCRIGGVADNPYLPGTILRPTWSGAVSPSLAVVLVLVSALTGVGLRHTRVRPTRLGIETARLLGLAPAAGPAGVAGGSAGNGVQACGNATLWGEPCGQLYPADRPFEPGEWCIRCAQVYQKAERTLRFRVVSLFTADIDVLNGLERLDATSWQPDQARPPDARISGQERWVRLGWIEVPDVISVATLLQLVQERLGAWENEAPEDAKPAFELARRRASRLAAWIWLGHQEHRLTFARPTHRARLAVGPTRLRDLGLEVGQQLVLQLDVGLLPLELRTGFRQTFLEAGRSPIVQNSKQDLWIPVASPKVSGDGAWVPRIEGEALRTWLSLDRLRPEGVRGVSSPRPYAFEPELAEAPVQEGSLDLVRMPLEDGEPIDSPLPGRSVSEWAWIEERHLELLRQHALVMVARP